MDCIGAINLTITLPLIHDVHALWLQLPHFSKLPSKLSKERGHHVVKSAVERKH